MHKKICDKQEQQTKKKTNKHNYDGQHDEITNTLYNLRREYNVKILQLNENFNLTEN